MTILTMIKLLRTNRDGRNSNHATSALPRRAPASSAASAARARSPHRGSASAAASGGGGGRGLPIGLLAESMKPVMRGQTMRSISNGSQTM